MKIKITLGELLEKHDWEKACKILGLNEWCLNEGLAKSDDEIELTEEQSKELGIGINN